VPDTAVIVVLGPVLDLKVIYFEPSGLKNVIMDSLVRNFYVCNSFRFYLPVSCYLLVPDTAVIVVLGPVLDLKVIYFLDSGLKSDNF